MIIGALYYSIVVVFARDLNCVYTYRFDRAIRGGLMSAHPFLGRHLAAIIWMNCNDSVVETYGFLATRCLRTSFCLLFIEIMSIVIPSNHELTSFLRTVPSCLGCFSWQIFFRLMRKYK